MRIIIVGREGGPSSVTHPSVRDEAITNWDSPEFQALCPSAEDHLRTDGGRWGRPSGHWSVVSQKIEMHVVNDAEERAHEYCSICGHRTSALPRYTWTTLVEIGTEVGYRFIHAERVCEIVECGRIGYELHR